MMQERVLITGATSGLGLSLAQTFCSAGCHVTATGRSETHRKRLESYGAEFIRADLTDDSRLEPLCRDQGTIVHAAALSASWGNPADFYDANVRVTENLLAVARKSRSRRFVYISSPSIYAAMRDQYGLTEQSSPRKPPLNHYAKTKLLAERLVLSKNAPDFHTLAIRPRAIVGPDDKVLLPKLLNLIREGKLPVFRNGRAEIELTDVRDVARATYLAASKAEQLQGQAINVSGGRPVPVRQLAEKLAEAIGCSPRFVDIPFPIAFVLAHILEWHGALSGYGTEPKLTRYSFATLAYSQTFDLTLAREKLGFTPVYDAVATVLNCARRSVL
jgi:2-alkyl-3-oxoalkanoate reductase